MNPKISVLLPVYNSDRYISESIESILNQTFQDFELIILNDGSSDKSLDRILEHNDKRMRVYSHENIGLSATLNKGISLSTADWIARMDADDICHPERLKLQYDTIEQNKEIALVASNVTYIDSDGTRLGKSIIPSTDLALRALLKKANYIHHPTVVFNKKAAIQAGGYDVRIGKYFEDYLLWINLSKQGKIITLPECLLNYRIHNNSISSNTPEELNEIIAEVGRLEGLSDDLLIRYRETLEKTATTTSKTATAATKRKYGYHLPEPLRILAIQIRDILKR